MVAAGLAGRGGRQAPGGAGGRRVRAAPLGGRREPLEARGRGPPEGHRQRPRLAQRLRGRARAGRGAHGVRGRAACRGVPLRGPARHGRLEPRAGGPARGPGRARGLPRPARAGLDRPGGGARRGGRRGPRDDAVRRLEQVRRHHGDRELPRLLLRAPQGAGRAPRRAPLRGHHRRGHVPPAGGARPGLPRRLRQPVRHRRPLLGAQLLRHGAGRAHRRRPGAAARRRARDRRRAAVRTCRRARTPPCASAPCSGRRRSPAATSSRSSPSRRSAPLGAWIEQLVAESTGKEGTGILPVDLEGLGDADVYGEDRVVRQARPGETWRRRGWPGGSWTWPPPGTR